MGKLLFTMVVIIRWWILQRHHGILRETILFLIEQNDGKIRKVLISIIKDFSDSLLAEQLLKQYKEV